MAVAIVCVAAIMLIISADAVLRYALRAPIPWAFELLTYYLMVAGIYFAVAGAFTHGDHINIDLFLPMMSARTRAMCGAVYSLLTAVVFGLIALSTGMESFHAWSNREFLPGYIVWPAWLSSLPVALGAALLAVRMVVHGLTLLIRGTDPEVASAGGHDA